MKSDTTPTVAVTGASGLIGSALVTALRSEGHRVKTLVRRPPLDPDEVQWQPGRPLDPAALEGVGAVVHLAGAGVGDRRWTTKYKRLILQSRVDGTDTIARAMAAMPQPPAVLVSASAIGFYGDTGDRAVDESAPQGEGFLADVVAQWEAAADPARQAGIRVVHPRTGLVVSSRGGAWARLFPFFKAGIGGRLGSGRQYWSWISLRDEIAALQHLLVTDLAGPVNLTAPEPVTNAAVTVAMGEALRRPAVLPVPALALRIYSGEFSSDVLGSLRVLPARLEESGFHWRDRNVLDATRAALSGW